MNKRNINVSIYKTNGNYVLTDDIPNSQIQSERRRNHGINVRFLR